MKNLKKLLAVIVAICVLATFTVPAFAEEAVKTDAEICADLKVLEGTTSGVDAEYLAKGTTRIQAAIISLRLAGKEDEALAFEGTENFADADEVQWAGGKAALAYLKANPDLGWEGSTSGNFFAYEAASAQMIYKVLLEGLGYKQGADFEWADVIEFAEGKGLVKVADIAKLTNNDVAIAIVEALKANVKDGEKTLAETLVEAGAIDKAAAVAAGLYSDELTATVAATGAKKLTVTFNQAVDSAKAVITVKKGTIAVNTDKVEFAEDKKSAVITTTTNLTEGDYTVTVTGLSDEAISATVKVENEKVANINVTSAKAPRVSDTAGSAKNAKVAYEVLNQYGEKMKGVAITWTISTGVAIANNDATNCTFEIVAAGGADFVPGAIVYITGVHAASGTVVNTSVEVALASKADSITFKGVYDRTKAKLADLPAGFADARWTLLYEAMDQYGNKIATPSVGDLVFTSNNPAFVASTFAAGADVIIDGVNYEAMELDPGSAVNSGGTATIQAISIVTGKISTFEVTAEALAAVKTFTMSAPAGIIAETETVEIPFTAIDQYGNAITGFDSLNTSVTFTSNKVLAFEKQNDGSAKLKYTAPSTGAEENVDLPSYLTSLVTAGGNFSSLMVSVKQTARPVSIVGLDAAKGTNIARGNYVDIKAEDLIIQDQYGRTMSDTTVNNWIKAAGANSIEVTSDTAATTAFTVKIGVGADTSPLALVDETTTIRITAAAVDAATEVITFKLATSNDGTTPIDASAKAITFTKTEKSQYSSYVVDDFGTMYNDGAVTKTDAKWDKTVKVYGVLADGTKVRLPVADYSVAVDTAKLAVAAGVISDVLDAAGPPIVAGYTAAEFKDGTADKDITVNVLVTVNDLGSGSAISIIEKTLTVSNIAAKVATVTFDTETDVVEDGKATIKPEDNGTVADTSDDTIVAAKLLTFIDEVKDQYGVDFTETPSITITNLTKADGSGFTVANNGTATAGITAAIMGDKFTATYKYASGVSVKIDFTVGLPE